MTVICIAAAALLGVLFVTMEQSKRKGVSIAGKVLSKALVFVIVAPFIIVLVGGCVAMILYYLGLL